MKLSEKGIETIFSALLKTIEERDLVFRQISQGVFKKHIEALDFEPDDFEMTTTPKEVRLTVEEAKHLLCIVMDCKHDHCITQEEAETFREFVKRIEQAEKEQ